jgi:peroxiredoxin
MRLFFFVIALFVCTLAQAQVDYKINGKIEGLKDTTIYLGYYYGEGTFVKDTAQINHTGEFVFEDRKPLPKGVYFLVLDRAKLFEIVIGDNQHFSLETSKDDYIKSMKVKHDVDNKLFFENMLFNMKQHQAAEPFIKIIQDSTLSEDKKKEARAAFSKIDNEVNAYQDEVIKSHPGTMTAKLFKATKVITVPDPIKKPDGAIDSTFQLRWYRGHFFDNFDLSDEAMIHLPKPLYMEKVNEYLDKLYAPQADSILKAIGKMASLAKKNKATYDYLIRNCLLKYQTPKIMGLDEVFVGIYDNYIATGEMNSWVNDKLKKNLKEYADRIRLSMLGMKAPDLIMKAPDEKIYSMYNLKNRYTLVFFFDPNCGHCRKETPKLVEFYNRNKTRFDLDVYAVSTDSSMNRLKAFITEMKTPWTTVNFYYSAVGHYNKLYDAVTMPTLYVLDDKKKIIGKKINAEQLEGFLSNYENFIKKMPVRKP